MTAPARLLALRVQGFKSFAERTVVEFGAGISAVVGPNGSGKSNLADALRWALGEQGRALRSRRAEDVIFAGSERRAALGMADVTLVVDNADGLLPVEFSVLELSRRLYRSGENEYLLNRQRVRLRDLVELLDSAHLADNAFLFIGQGMVDQALALRPEERRPLFEEVAGVRRHERRRRRAEDHLAEAETNLARVEDILGELRPQARRLAAQAEQQASRATAADELAAGLLAAAHARWHVAAGRAKNAAEVLDSRRAEADASLAALQAAEDVAAAVAADLGRRADAERERRQVHEHERATVVELQLRGARLTADLENITRERRRAADERELAEGSLTELRRELAVTEPVRDADADAALAEAERALADALGELGSLRAETRARGEEAAALRRAHAARQAELEGLRRRLPELEGRLADERAKAAAIGERLAAAEARRADRWTAIAAAESAVDAAVERRREAATALETAEAAARTAAGLAAAAAERSAALRGALDGLRSQLDPDGADPLARVAAAVGGRPIADGLDVEPAFLAAVEAALGDAARAYLLPIDAIEDAAGGHGAIVLDDPTERASGARDDEERGAVRERAVERGGGPLHEAIRRDPTGAARRMLTRAVWVPTLDDALALLPSLAPGWLAVTRAGDVVAPTGLVLLGRGDAHLRRRADVDRRVADLATAEEEARRLTGAADRAAVAVREASAAAEAAAADERSAVSARRRVEDDERTDGRETERLARESAWLVTQLERHEAELERVAGLARRLEAEETSEASDPATAGPVAADALRAWEARATQLRARRDGLAAAAAERDRARRDAEDRRARAGAGVTIAEERIGRAERELTLLGERDRALVAELDALSAELATVGAREAAALAALEEVRTADAADRERLASAERSAAGARDRLRSAEESLRAAEIADVEARLALESIREGILVELGGLGEIAERHLAMAVGAIGEAPAAAGVAVMAPARDDDARAGEGGDQEPEAVADEGPVAIERLLARVADHWAITPPVGEAPAPGRLATLRRRYHELGAANPYAAAEYAEVRARLDTLEAQRADLRSAITGTRTLIDELNAMIADQFRQTFAALETAFDARFRQLFGGGFARLSLTDPTDLTATGVEIVARPPGKKTQALGMLSGGERALTAVALLFAMLEVRPVPFCVLDEVDAALDEANIGRFAEALRSLADRTQFVVITHNRGTIEQADALYGVTIGDDAVSRVISLRLDEARSLAEARPGGSTADPAGVAG